MPARVSWRDQVSEPITIRDLSAWGFRAELPDALGLRAMFRVELPTGRTVHAQVVRLDRDASACEFLIRLDPEQFDMLAQNASTTSTFA